MANINIKYPEYPDTESYEIDDKTYVAVAVTGHPNMNKCTIHFDTYSGRSGGSVKRVGELFRVQNNTYADFVISNTQYVLDIKTGTICSMVDFSIKTDTPLRMLKGLKPSDDNSLNELLSRDKTFRYQMLGRLKADCEYYLGYGCGNKERLWTKNVSKQIYYIKALYYSFSGQDIPTWFHIGHIKELESQMKQFKG